MFDEDLWKEWRWTERYPEQHEVRAYLEHVAERYDLLRDITFNTRVQSFPANLIAGMFGFHPRQFFEMENAADRENVAVKF